MHYPSGWYGDASATSLTVTSYPVHQPDYAIKVLPSGGAFIFIIDYPAYSAAARTSPPRPSQISLVSPGNYELFGTAYRIEFRDHHHGILAFVALGKHASRVMRATAVAALNSISVSG